MCYIDIKFRFQLPAKDRISGDVYKPTYECVEYDNLNVTKEISQFQENNQQCI